MYTNETEPITHSVRGSRKVMFSSETERVRTAQVLLRRVHPVQVLFEGRAMVILSRSCLFYRSGWGIDANIGQFFVCASKLSLLYVKYSHLSHLNFSPV